MATRHIRPYHPAQKNRPATMGSRLIKPEPPVKDKKKDDNGAGVTTAPYKVREADGPDKFPSAWLRRQ